MEFELCCVVVVSVLGKCLVVAVIVTDPDESLVEVERVELFSENFVAVVVLLVLTPLAEVEVTGIASWQSV